jgi:hypothetical protein
MEESVAEFVFTVHEVNRNGYIAWDATEGKSGHVIPLNEARLTSGTYSDIQAYLKQALDLDVKIAYDANLGDKLEGQTWTYVRGANTIIIRDIPRTVFRLSGLTT